MNLDVQNKLRDVLTGRDTVEMGQFKWVNLEMVKDQAGGDWASLRSKIYDTSAKFIERRLGENDVLLRCQGGFMIIFSELEGPEAADKVEEISLALNVFFLGDKVLRQLKIEAEARSITPAEFMSIVSTSVEMEDSSISDDDEPLDESHSGEGKLADMRQPPTGPPAEETRPSAPDQSIKQKALGSTAALSEPDWTEQEKEISESEKDDVRWQKTRHAVAQSDSGEGWKHAESRKPDEQAPRWTKAAPIEKKPDAPSLPKAVFAESGAHWDDIVFKPCWDARQNVMSVNFCLARRTYRDEVLYGRDTLLGSDNADVNRELDRAIAIAAQRAFQQQFAKKMTCAIGIPVHYDTIAKVSDRVSYFSILQSVPQKLRKFFFFRIDGIPKGAPVMQMQELFRSMKGFGSNLLAKLDFADRDLKRFEGCGIDLFGAEIPWRINQNGVRDEDVTAIYELVASAQLLGAETYLTDVDDYEAFSAALSTGVRYMSGKILGEETALPAKITPYPLLKIRQRWEPSEDEPDAIHI
jgi:hypothetical protein